MNKINIERWREIRNHFSRREILYYWIKYKLKLLKYYVFHLWFKISKYEHKHIFESIFRCSICRKDKLDIDREWLKKKNGSN